MVWVATRFRDEFRRSLDWLNERTDTGVDFFGVEVGVAQIGDSGPAAPVFDVVARPNGWQKAVKEQGVGPGRARGQGNQARQEFYAEILTEVATARPGVRVPRPGDGNWINFAAGPFGTWGIVIAGDGRLRIEAHLDSEKEVNKRLFDELASDAQIWAERVGVPLEWERMDDRKASRIASYHAPFPLDDADAREDARRWAVSTLLQMYDVLNDTLRRRGRELRHAVDEQGLDAGPWPEVAVTTQ